MGTEIPPMATPERRDSHGAVYSPRPASARTGSARTQGRGHSETPERRDGRIGGCFLWTPSSTSRASSSTRTPGSLPFSPICLTHMSSNKPFSITPAPLLSPSTCSLKCTNCTKSGISCTVSSKSSSGIKQTRCDKCELDGVACLFTRLLSGRPPPPLKVAKNCIHCQIAHQSCAFNGLEDTCLRCQKLGLECLFKVSSQGSRKDLLASNRNPNHIAHAASNQSSLTDEM